MTPFMSFSPKCFRALLLLLTLSCTLAAKTQEDFLEPAQAFKLALQQTADGSELLIQFEITPGHYMYGDAFKLTGAHSQVLKLHKPEGVRAFDETFQKEVETHRGRIQLRSSLPVAADALWLTSQGCADRGLCYPPIQVQLRREGNGWTFSPVVAPDLTFGSTVFVQNEASLGSKPAAMATELRLDRLLAVISGFLALMALWVYATKAKS
jgi:thioredoxin:protein disulfide reductase